MQSIKYDIEKLLREGTTVQFMPVGTSMCPVFGSNRDVAIVAPYRSQRIHRGDVLLYRRSEKGIDTILVLHRVYRVGDDGYYMVGDNQVEIEGPVKQDHVLGIMTGMIRKGKRINVNRNILYIICTRAWLLLRVFRPKLYRIRSEMKKRCKGEKRNSKET